MHSNVFFHRTVPFEAALHQQSIARMLEGTDPLPNGMGQTLLLGLSAAGTPVAACEIAYSGGIANVRFGVDERYADSGIDESLFARALLSARNAGARKVRMEFAKNDERRALTARQGGMRVDRSGEKWIAEESLAPGDAFAFGLEYWLSFFVPVPAECR